MKRRIDFARRINAGPAVAFAFAVLLVASSAAGQTNYCNNPVPPCDPDNPVTLCYLPPTPPPLCEPLQCGKCTKSPCYVASGGYVYGEVDLAIRTTGLPIGVARTYQSAQTIDGPTGYGWTSSLSTKLYYTVFLSAAPDTYTREAHVRVPNGSVYRFIENGDGSFRSPPGRFDTLVRNVDGTWDLHTQGGGSLLRFSDTGNLLTVSDAYGNTQRWTYLNDRLQRIEDASGSGRFVEITYGGDGRISDVTDMTGRNVRYTYDSRGVMTSTTNPAHQATAYSYKPGKYVPLLAGVTDHWGRGITTVVYDAQDRVKSYTDDGETYTYSYVYGGVATTTAKTDSSGNRWVYSFDANGLVKESRTPDGSAPPRVTYDSNGAVLTETDSVGVKTAYSYDTSGKWLTTTWDAGGSAAVQWRVTYDQQFPDRHASVKAYDPATNQLHRHWQGTQTTYHPPGSAAPGAVDSMFALDSDGVTTRLSAAFVYDQGGRIVRVTRASGAVTDFRYDALGNLVSIESPANNPAGTRPVTTYAYDSLGRIASVTDAEGRVTTYAWDSLDRVSRITLPKPAAAPVALSVAYEYDIYDSAKGLLFARVTGVDGGTTQHGADQFGREIETIDSSGGVRRTLFNKGLPEALLDANGYRTSYTWDVKRRLSAMTFPDGTSERFTYYADDTVATKTDRANRVTTLTYDGLKRIVRESISGVGSISYFDEGEKLVKVVDTRSSPSDTLDYTWDSAFQVASESQGSRGTVNYSYTPEGRLGTASVSGGASTTYSYYPDGSIRGIGWSPVSGEFDVSYTLSGHRSSITFPNGQIRSYSYDALGRLTRIANTHPQTGLLAAFEYGYDLDAATGQPTAAGLRTSVTANVPAIGLTNAITKLGYDGRRQLIRAEYPATGPYAGTAASWTYDAAGHRTGVTSDGISTAYSYAKVDGNTLNSPRLTHDGGNTYSYDAEGNVSSRTGTRGNYIFGWTAGNLLQGISGDVSASYSHDFGGRRTEKSVNGSSTSYVYDRQHIAVENGATRAEYVYAPGTDEPLAMLRGGQVYYYSADGLASIVALTDSAGTVQNSYAWDIWGSEVFRAENVSNPFGYTGREFAEAGLHHYRLRAYEPATGRFASEDPLQDAVAVTGADLYSYAANSPALYRDPFGLEPELKPCGADYPALPPGCPPIELLGAYLEGGLPKRCLEALADAAAAQPTSPFPDPGTCDRPNGCIGAPSPYPPSCRPGEWCPDCGDGTWSWKRFVCIYVDVTTQMPANWKPDPPKTLPGAIMLHAAPILGGGRGKARAMPGYATPVIHPPGTASQPGGPPAISLPPPRWVLN